MLKLPVAGASAVGTSSLCCLCCFHYLKFTSYTR